MPAITDRAGVDQALLDRTAERGAVEVPLAVVLVPGVGVRVEQHQRHRAVDGVLGAELAEHDRVVAAEDERHDPGLEQGAKARVDLLGRAQGVAGGHSKVTAVDERQRAEHVDAERRVIRAQQHRGRPDRLGTEARAAPKAGRGVERNPDHRGVDVVARQRDVRQPGERAHAGVARRDRCVRRLEMRHLLAITNDSQTITPQAYWEETTTMLKLLPNARGRRRPR